MKGYERDFFFVLKVTLVLYDGAKIRIQMFGFFFFLKNPDVLVLSAGFSHYTRGSKSTQEYPSTLA